jgi:hypothetical protein
MLTLDSDENTDHIENFVRFGVNITGLKAKLAKKTYLLILFTNSLILLFAFLNKYNKNFYDINSSFFKDHLNISLPILIVLLLAVILLKNDKKKPFLRILYFFFWFLWLSFFSFLISFLCSYIENFTAFFLFFYIHHLLMTSILIFKNEYNITIFWLNLLMSIFGIIILCVQKVFDFSHVYIQLLVCIQYLLVNVFYFLVIQYFNFVQEKEFWKKRSFLIFFIIYLFSNLTIISIVLLAFYFLNHVCQKRKYEEYFKEDSDLNIDSYYQQKH